jgi:hypothetical protein
MMGFGGTTPVGGRSNLSIRATPWGSGLVESAGHASTPSAVLVLDCPDGCCAQILNEQSANNIGRRQIVLVAISPRLALGPGKGKQQSEERESGTFIKKSTGFDSVVTDGLAARDDWR